MSKKKRESFFWASYSDLMTSLFFVMLVLFFLTIALLKVRLEEFEKIEKIKKAMSAIDSEYFEYNEEHEKHVLNVEVQFPTDESEINTLKISTQAKLIEAGKKIQKSIEKINKEYPKMKIQYLLIIEGQASKDGHKGNDRLSYARALALSKFWEHKGINFGKNCEVLISGSGEGGSMRDPIDEKNKRFLIHIIPKTGIILENEKN